MSTATQRSELSAPRYLRSLVAVEVISLVAIPVLYAIYGSDESVEASLWKDLLLALTVFGELVCLWGILSLQRWAIYGYAFVLFASVVIYTGPGIAAGKYQWADKLLGSAESMMQILAGGIVAAAILELRRSIGSGASPLSTS